MMRQRALTPVSQTEEGAGERDSGMVPLEQDIFQELGRMNSDRHVRVSG